MRGSEGGRAMKRRVTCCAVNDGRGCEQEAKYEVGGPDPNQVSYFCADCIAYAKLDDEYVERIWGGSHEAR